MGQASCCCSDNRADKQSDIITSHTGFQDKKQGQQNNSANGGYANGNGQKGDYHDIGHPMLDIPQAGFVVPKEEIAKAALLQIMVVEGLAVDKNTLLKINACGLIASKRNKSDGCTIIGSQEANKNGEVLNDFVIPSTDVGIGKRHFIIKYNLDNKSYYLRDLGDGSGTFVRLDVPLILKHGYIISFGDSHMVVQFCDNKIDKTSKIQCKFLDGPKTDQTFTFSENSGIIRIGRMTNCDIKFDDSSLSRLQCIIQYQDGHWILSDGDGQKLSTNGTWLFVDELFKIYDNMIFKAGQTLFKAQLLPSQR
eukprot:403337469